jgi:phosphoglycerate dehydrogenase-like enzyme
MVPAADADLQRIAAIDPRIHVVDARGVFDAEIGENWSQWTVDRYLSFRKITPSSREERDRMLATAEVVLGGWPPLLNLRSRAPRLRWFHQTPAGASNLLRSDLWGSDVTVTTSRGYGNTRAMAEYVLACFYDFARELHQAYHDRVQHHFEHRRYRPIVLEGKTVCVVGAGGIGLAVGELCAKVGMHVIGTRRRVKPAEPLPPGFTWLEPPGRLMEMLPESDCIAICCQWTPETTKLIGREAFAAMKTGAILVNVARGEIIDEEALVAALGEGKLRGVGLDVYVGEFEHEPDRRLWDNPRVLITPHVSGHNDVGQHRGIDLFCENLRAYLDDRPLINVIDWTAGY